MFARLSKLSAGAAVVLAAAGTLALPTAASAQSYGYVQGYGNSYSQPYAYGQSNYDRSYGDRGYYDPCSRERQGRTGAGATIGAGLGAVAGSQLAARGRRTEGSILGGVLGAVIGGTVGRSSSNNCDSRYNQSGYRYDTPAYSQGDDYAYDRGYGQPVYDDRYAQDDRYYDDRRDSYYGSNDGYGYERTCRTVETTRRDNYGRTVTTTRQVC